MNCEYNSQSYILDLGVGTGGAYLKRADSRLVCVDMNELAIKKARQRYGVNCLVADAYQLPFANETFDAVQMYYPHDSALMGLASQKSDLWAELYRVTKQLGTVTVVFDVYPYGHRITENNGTPYILNGVREAMIGSAAGNGFSVSIEKAGDRFLTEVIRTPFAQMAARRAREDKRYKNYRLSAIKV